MHEVLASQGEKGMENNDESITPIPYTISDRFIEKIVHPFCALLLLPTIVTSLILIVYLSFFALSWTQQKTLVKIAILYKKEFFQPLTESTIYELDITPVSIMFAVFVHGLLIGAPVLIWWVGTYVTPREMLLRNLPSAFLDIEQFVQFGAVASLASFTYNTYSERSATHKSGCSTYINKKGQHIGKCSLESALCGAEHWSDFALEMNIPSLCRKHVAVRYMTLVIAFLYLGLCAVYKHQKRLHIRHTTPQLREKLAKEEEEQEREKKEKRKEQGRVHWWRANLMKVLYVYMIGYQIFAWVRWYHDN